MPRRVLLAAISPMGTCTIGFGASMLKVQTALTRRPEIQATIKFFPRQKDAFSETKETHEYDTMVCIDADKAVPVDFLLDPLPPDTPCLMSPYPLAIIDWDRVQRQLAKPTCTEPAESVGHVYNFDPTRATPTSSPHLVRVPREAVREWGVFKCKADVSVDDVAHVVVDLNNPTTNHGTVAFTGCVGARHVLRQ